MHNNEIARSLKLFSSAELERGTRTRTIHQRTIEDDTIDISDEKDELFGQFDIEDETSTSLSEADTENKDENISNKPNSFQTSGEEFLKTENTSRDPVSHGILMIILFQAATSSIHLCSDSEGEDEAKSIFSVLQQSYIPVLSVETNPVPAVLEGSSEDINSGQERGAGDIDTFEGDKLKKILQRSAVKSDLISDEDDEDDSDRSLLIPLLALSAIAGLTLALAAFRLFYSRFYKDKEEFRHSHR